MNKKYFIGIIVALLISVAGCKKAENLNIVDSIDNNSFLTTEGGRELESEELTYENNSSGQNPNIVIIDYNEENGTNAELVRELMKDLVDQDAIKNIDTESIEDEEEAMVEITEIIIENFRGNPKDITIKQGTAVRWVNMMYLQNIIIILPKEDGSYSSKWINDLKELWYNETYEYIFTKPGNYKWGSKTKFDKIYGTVTVVS